MGKAKGRTSSRGRTVGRGKARSAKKPAPKSVAKPSGRRGSEMLERAMSPLEAHEAMVRANVYKSVSNISDKDKAFLKKPTLIKEDEDKTEKAAPILAAAGRMLAGYAMAGLAGAAKDAALPTDTASTEDTASKSHFKNLKDEVEKSVRNAVDAIKANPFDCEKSFASEAQRRYFYAAQQRGEIPKKTVKEFESKTPKNVKLPEYAPKNKKD